MLRKVASNSGGAAKQLNMKRPDRRLCELPATRDVSMDDAMSQLQHPLALSPTFDFLISRDDVCSQANMSSATLYRLIASGSFPKPVKVGAASRWSQQAVQTWIREKVAAARTNEGQTERGSAA